ncbi:nucleotidyltransferase domain-containing protein [Clostridium thailandense]|uniref:nucleotidyltransferase domain-containing protein n=1 Tax=Clostridium thailandense TaxID=2794346 RepID=UPI0039898C61
MELHEKLGIKKHLLIQIQDIVSKCINVEKALIFGSRAKGNYKKNSDIDIAILGKDVSLKELNIMVDSLNELSTVLDFDVINIETISKKELLDNILKDGVEIYVKR